MTPEIIKVQRPILLTGPGACWRMYDQNRTRQQTVRDAVIPAHVLRAVNGSYKAYFRATWAPDGGWEIGERVEDQAW